MNNIYVKIEKKFEATMKLTIEEYSKKFKMSKEMVHSKIKANKLDYVIEDSQTFILLSDPQKKQPRTTQTPSTEKSTTTVATILALYKRENHYLKLKINQLEDKIDKLINDKEQMLRDERDRIEQIYSNKDEQLQHILELINAKMQHELQENENILEVEHKEYEQITELKSYLKTLDLKQQQRKAIKKRFENVAKKDIRVIEQNGKLYLDFTRYDYSDLLAL